MRRVRRHASTARAVLLGASALLATSWGLAQPDWTRTGTVDVMVDGEASTLHTFVAHVDEDLAEGIEDAAARDLAARVAGTDQHTATWMVTDPITAGGTVIAPAMMFVLIDARADGDPSEGTARLSLEFGIDPSTHEPLPDAEVAMRYHPAPYDARTSYATTEGTLELGAIERVDDATLAVTGSIRGVLEFEGDAAGDHEPLPVEAEFRIDHVVGSSLLSDLVQPD